MSPNCSACNQGDHGGCTTRYEGDCACADGGHGASVIDQETSTPVPNYAILDLWMALGNEPNHEFDDAIAVRGKADVWAYLLSSVRALNDRGRIEATVGTDFDPQDSSTWPKAGFLGEVKRSYPDLIEAALREIRNNNITGVGVTYDFDSNTAFYTFTVEG